MVVDPRVAADYGVQPKYGRYVDAAIVSRGRSSGDGGRIRIGNFHTETAAWSRSADFIATQSPWCKLVYTHLFQTRARRYQLSFCDSSGNRRS